MSHNDAHVVHGDMQVDGELYFTHTEYVCDIRSLTDAFDIRARMEINAGVHSSFPVLSEIAGNFETYSFEQLRITYRSTLAQMNHDAAGSVTLSPSYNANAGPYATKQAAMNAYGAASSLVTGEAHVDFLCGAGSTRVLNGVHVVRDGSEEPYRVDKSVSDLGFVQVSLMGVPPGLIIGEIWVSYTVRLMNVHARRPIPSVSVDFNNVYNTLVERVTDEVEYVGGTNIHVNDNDEISLVSEPVVERLRLTGSADLEADHSVPKWYVDNSLIAAIPAGSQNVVVTPSGIGSVIELAAMPVVTAVSITSEPHETYHAATKGYTDLGDAASVGSANAYALGTILPEAKAYADVGDASVLSSANAYADGKMAHAVNTANGYTDVAKTDAVGLAKVYTDGEIAAMDAALRTYINVSDTITLGSANSYTAAGDASVLSSAKAYADGQMAHAVSTANGYTDVAKTDAVGWAKVYTDGEIAAMDAALHTYINVSDTVTLGSANSYALNTILPDAKAYALSLQSGTKVELGVGCTASATSVAIGSTASAMNSRNISIGSNVGGFNDADANNTDKILIGTRAGAANSGKFSICIGTDTNCSADSVAIGRNTTGSYMSLTMGYSANTTHSNCVMLNASGSGLSSTQASSTFIKPIRTVTGSTNSLHTLLYNVTSGEVSCAYLDGTVGGTVFRISSGQIYMYNKLITSAAIDKLLAL